MISDVLAQKITSNIQKHLYTLAQKHDFVGFYKMHQLEVIKSAELLLKNYPQADKNIVIISCWFHDIRHFQANGEGEINAVKPLHHIDGAVEARKILNGYKIEESDIEKIVRCIERHRNSGKYIPENIEEKIVACADALSHFYSIFFLTFFKFHPSVSFDEMVPNQIQKLERDWRDVNMLPEAGELVKERYKILKKMLSSYGKTFIN